MRPRLRHCLLPGAASRGSPLGESPYSQNIGSARGWLPGVAPWRVPVLPEHRFWERCWILTEKGTEKVLRLKPRGGVPRLNLSWAVGMSNPKV